MNDRSQPIVYAIAQWMNPEPLWMVRIPIPIGRKYLGPFKTKEEAVAHTQPLASSPEMR